jgi:dihydroorotase
MIDDQVHFREPGLTHKGDIATESAAAVAGGITTYMEMPNVNPLTINAQALEDKYQRATGRSHANFAFYLGASNDNLEEIKNLDPQAACGVKVFMGASTGNMLVDDPEVLDGIFAHAPILVATHCEDSPMIQANEALAREKYGEEVPFSEHPNIRSEEACWKSSSFAVALAKKHGTRLHVLHITTAKELALFEPGELKGKRITAEACVHHLWFSQEDYARLGAQIKCNPAVKRKEDRDAILQAVAEGRIDIIATDHAPHTWEEKQGSYFKAPAGLPLVQHALPSLLDHYQAGRLSLETIVQKVCHNPAEAFQVKDRGYLREGYFADLVLVDLQKETTVTKESLLYKCGWSPFEGHTFQNRIVTTLVNGGIAWHEGQPGQKIHGQRLTFNR